MLMNNYILSCCSTADLSKEYFAKRDISYICFHYQLAGKDYRDDMGQTMSLSDFYNQMRDGADTKTSQINADEFEEYFEGFLKQGFDILHVSLSSGISGVVNSANIAKDILKEKYPGRKIYIIDSLCASSGYGLFVDKLADLRDEGKTIDEVFSFGEENKRKLNHWFFTDDLTYLIRGGRVSKAAGVVAGVLKICPLMDVDNDGKLIVRDKIRTTKKVMQQMLERMEKYASSGTSYTGKCFISQSDCYDKARLQADMIEEKFKNIDGSVQIFPIGTTIGSHTGPGTVALFFWGDERL